MTCKIESTSSTEIEKTKPFPKSHCVWLCVLTKWLWLIFEPKMCSLKPTFATEVVFFSINLNQDNFLLSYMDQFKLMSSIKWMIFFRWILAVLKWGVFAFHRIILLMLLKDMKSIDEFGKMKDKYIFLLRRYWKKLRFLQISNSVIHL